ncbi:LOB domain-containing protein 29 [Stylosanthes scabra]|uniref:LOB domain-containing protein 29 n=1 Tax=Stylosanthes scabra TaxID=79078 RepID=A0ABU6XQU3_9FABA|nr:LOB domain-containing protein 29 [Stylosanthes scabra]
MTGSGSPCGACKFLRRKCLRGCVFAPYFCHEEGATHFAAIHKVFGASNVSKLLAHLPVAHRCEAAVTISYEAQARLQDPIYGCVSHIFALQQQVVNLQAQLAYLREQATQRCNLNASLIENPNNNEDYFGKPTTTSLHHQDLKNYWFQRENSTMAPQFLSNSSNYHSSATQQYHVNTPPPPTSNSSLMLMDTNPIGNYENSSNVSFNSCSSLFDESCDSVFFDMKRLWALHEVEELQ